MTRRVFASVLASLPAAAQIKNKVTNDDNHPGQQERMSNMNAASKLPSKKAAPVTSPIQSVLTRSYDNLRSCSNLNETTLTPANVGGLKKLFSLKMSGDARGCEAQPLIVAQVPWPDGTTRDVVLLCSMANTVWCYDANDGTLLWVQRVGNPIKGSAQIDAWGINDHWGILSTPVIDPDTLILYGCAWSSTDGTPANGTHSVFSLNIKDGSQAFPMCSLENATYTPPAGSGLAPLVYKTLQRKQRASLLLTSVNDVKTVFVAAGTIAETSAGARGWVIAIDANTMKITAALATCARYSGAGIWMAGQGLSSDPAGFLYAMTGNGGFDGITDFGECFLKMQYTPATSNIAASLAVVDWWSPFSDAGRVGANPTLPDIPANAPVNNAGYDDMDLGSGGPALLPWLGLILGAGKDGILYVLNDQKMGKTMPADFANPAGNYAKLAAPPIWFTFFPGYGVNAAPPVFTSLNQLYFNVTHHNHSTPVVYNRGAGNPARVFCWGENGALRAWDLAPTGVASFVADGEVTASAQAPVPPGGMPGAMMCLSANGQTNAILFGCVPSLDANKQISPGYVYAYDALNLTTHGNGGPALKVLWQSPQYTYNKFNVPVVSGGRLFVPTYSGSVDVYGL